MRKQFMFRLTKPLALIVLFIWTGSFLQAQISLSLVDAVDSAMVRSPEIKQYQSNLRQKQMVNRSSIGVFLPKVDVVGGYSYFSQNPEINMSLVKGSMDDIAGKYGAVNMA